MGGWGSIDRSHKEPGQTREGERDHAHGSLVGLGFASSLLFLLEKLGYDLGDLTRHLLQNSVFAKARHQNQEHNCG